MQKKHTAESRSPQVSSRTTADNTRRERTRQKFRFLAAVKSKVSSDRGRKICKDLKVSHRLVADLADEIATGRYPSFTSCGHVYVGQKALGAALGVHQRQVRRAIAALKQLGLLRLEQDHGGRRTNLMTPLLDGRPLLDELDGIAHERANTSSSQRAGVSSNERASAPSDLKEEEEQKDSSPEDPSALEAVPPKAVSVEEQVKIGLESLSRVEVNFARLMRDYPHPPGSLDQLAYRPSARTVWNRLTPEQQHGAAQAALRASGKQWLKYWLQDGLETGGFEVVDRPPVPLRAWVREGTLQWKAWQDHYRASGQEPPKTQRRVGGEQQTGWMFKTEWPPVVEQAPSPEVRDE
jgi:DNA-binding MarR family transcriptional regulator